MKGKLGAVLAIFELKGKLGNQGEAMGFLCHFEVVGKIGGVHFTFELKGKLANRG